MVLVRILYVITSKYFSPFLGYEKLPTRSINRSSKRPGATHAPWLGELSVLIGSYNNLQIQALEAAILPAALASLMRTLCSDWRKVFTFHVA